MSTVPGAIPKRAFGWKVNPITMKIQERVISGCKVRQMAYYTDDKIVVYFPDNDVRKEEFKWGDSEMFNNELEARKASEAFMDGLEIELQSEDE